MSVLSGSTAVVTGGSRGIGLAVARGLAAEGVRLLLVSRGGTALEAAAKQTGGHGVTADLATNDGVDRVVAATHEQLGGAPDVLINNAGIFRLAPASVVTPEDFDLHLALNLQAPFRLTRAFLPAMLERASGVLVHVGSVAGRQPFPGNAAYGASKYGLRGLHEVLCTELAGTGVRSLLVEPGPVDTETWNAFEERLGQDLPSRSSMLKAETVAEAVLEALRLGAQGARSEILVLPA
jgi:NAD(P)-dependent dehydrogenase (short-subunit alcohol dehydrogenase family)